MTGGLAHCYFGCVCSFHVFGKAAGQEQPDCPEMFASLTALLFPCQKTLPERGQQRNAIDASDEVWKRSSLVWSVLSRAGEHYPSLGCHLSSLFSGIVTWGLSDWKSLLRLHYPSASPENLCLCFSLLLLTVMWALLHRVKGKLQLFQKRHSAWLPEWFAGFMTFIRGPCWIVPSDQWQWSLPLSLSCQLPFQSMLRVVQLLELIPHG